MSKKYQMMTLNLVSGLSGPINREMRHLISSLQNHNLQLKGDLQRYKRKLRETQMEINKVDMAHVETLAHLYSKCLNHVFTKLHCSFGFLNKLKCIKIHIR